ncbi:hypothetical protein [Paenibacillus sp. GP183]|jgi:hypothetical protein|uniref:hypothetical protein n=1 Tax=Paenibacillus sp. GP183 TaxID=1882751 RepID=UPI000895979C|nr:hypothetical protein [Paenibacillus sp. GP183]SEB44817.1 hypothetical protein SAMN05443246_0391 [Paenibacillus sp. GP183]
MTRPVQAYFNTESEAEDAKILLQTLAADMLEVGETGDEHLNGVRFIAPFTVAQGTLGGSGAINTGAGAAITNTTPIVGDLDTNKRENLNDLRYVLSGKVRDEDFDEAVTMIQRNNGHVMALD